MTARDCPCTRVWRGQRVTVVSVSGEHAQIALGKGLGLRWVRVVELEQAT